jgi:ParB family chromosome partitioning protein
MARQEVRIGRARRPIMTEKRRLGRGLDALLGGAMPGSYPELDLANGGDAAAATAAVPIERIALNPHQPRKDFDPEALAALKDSITTHGLLQPIVVRPVGENYQLIAGERRLRAAKEAGWQDIPVHVVDLNDQAVFEAALVENVQRTDLNAIEKALGFQEYLQKYGLKQDELAKKIGLDRSTISNLIRLLDLPPQVREAVRQNKISFGHARALLAFDDPRRQVTVCEEIIATGLSVRQVEALSKEAKAGVAPVLGESPEAITKTAHVKQIEDELRQALGTRVQIRLRGKAQGQFIIPFENNDEFERLVAAFRK